MLQEFINYLLAQVGMPYLWGGQHTKLTPENYVSTINKKEEGRGGYKNSSGVIVLTYAAAAIAFCKALFEAGASVLYAYDCSGLGVYWLYNLKKLYKSDVSANTMMQRCDLKPEKTPKKGWWLFKVDAKGKGTHIGYMVSDTEVVEAEGRKTGVVLHPFVVKSWDTWGIPQVFASEIEKQEEQNVKVIGGSVNVRTEDSTKGKKLFTAHKNDVFPLIEIAPSGWYKILTSKGAAFISNRSDLTKLV